MKKILLTMLVLTAGVVLSANSNAATSTSTLDVSATVSTGCVVSTTAVNFPVTDLATGVYAEGDVSVQCPLNTVYNIALDEGANYDGTWRRVSDGSGNNMVYDLYVDNAYNGNSVWGNIGHGDTYPYGTTVDDTGNGSPQPHVVYGALGFLVAPNVPDGDYSDVVNVTVTY